MLFPHLGTLATAQQQRRATSKGATPSRLQVKAAKQKDEKKQESAWKRAIWARDKGLCRMCWRKVIKTLALVPNQGHCHHIRGRNVAPRDRFNVAAALLLCASCHEHAHRHTVKVPTP